MVRTLRVNGIDRDVAGEPYVAFTEDAVRLGTGCNGGSGPAHMEAGRLVVEGLSRTEIGCAGPVADQEETLYAFLHGRLGVVLTGDDLVLTKGADELRLEDRTRVHPDRPLEGTTWRYCCSFDSTVASGPAGGPDIDLVFSAGRLRLTSACATATATATVGRSKVAISELVVEESAPCEGFRRVSSVLDGDLELSIRSDNLRLVRADGRGMSLDAR